MVINASHSVNFIFHSSVNLLRKWFAMWESSLCKHSISYLTNYYFFLNLCWLIWSHIDSLSAFWNLYCSVPILYFSSFVEGLYRSFEQNWKHVPTWPRTWYWWTLIENDGKTKSFCVTMESLCVQALGDWFKGLV